MISSLHLLWPCDSMNRSWGFARCHLPSLPVTCSTYLAGLCFSAGSLCFQDASLGSLWVPINPMMTQIGVTIVSF